MTAGKPGWELKVHNQDFDHLPEVPTKHTDEKYHFRGETFD